MWDQYVKTAELYAAMNYEKHSKQRALHGNSTLIMYAYTLRTCDNVVFRVLCRLRHFTTFFKKAAAVSLLVEGIFFIPSGDCTLMIYK